MKVNKFNENKKITTEKEIHSIFIIKDFVVSSINFFDNAEDASNFIINHVFDEYGVVYSDPFLALGFWNEKVKYYIYYEIDNLSSNIEMNPQVAKKLREIKFGL